MKKALSLILALVMCLSLCACGGGSGDKDTPKTIDTEYDAISAVKGDTGPFGTASRIASGLGFMFYSDPNYGVCSAERNDAGDWTVTLKGNMSGYTNETKTDFDSCGFVYTTTVTVGGSIGYGSTKRVD